MIAMIYYLVWYGGFRTNLPYDSKFVVAREMYDYEKDPFETENVLNRAEYQKDKAKMEQLFRDCMQREFKGCAEYSKLADYRAPINTNPDKNKVKAKAKKK